MSRYSELQAELNKAVEAIEKSKSPRLPYRFSTRHDLTTRTQLLNKLRDLQLQMAQAADLIDLIREDYKD